MADVEDPSSSRPQGEDGSSRVVPTMDTAQSDHLGSNYGCWIFYAAWGSTCSLFMSMVSTFHKVMCFPFHQAAVWWSRLSTTARAAIRHGSVVGFLLFHIIFARAIHCLPLQIVLYPPIACLHIWTSSGRMHKIVFAAFLGAFTMVVVDLSIIISGRGTYEYISSHLSTYPMMKQFHEDYIEMEVASRHGMTTLWFTANTVVLSSHCIWKLYPVAIRPWLVRIWELYLDPIARRAHPWLLQFLPHAVGHLGSSSFFFSTIIIMQSQRVLFLHASIVAVLLFHIIFALATDCLAMQIVIYPAIACLHIWASSGWVDITVFGAFLGALTLVVVFVAISAKGLDIGIMFMADIVAISFHCIWKLYTVAYPWLHQYWRRKLYPIARPWLQAWLQDEEAGRLLLLPRWQEQDQAAFRMREFSYDELRTMTQDFGNMVGQGGFAQVFRGVLPDDGNDGTAVAVKRIMTTAPVAGDDDDFLREISIVSTVHHRSLVRLLGYCLPREGGRYLVYPFFENGSLDSWLFHGDGTQERRRLLPWPARRGIAVDVAKALAYLHHECWQQILHLDVKPGNILLDGNLRAHISDFGISMSITRDMSSVDTHGRGTPGYMAPEMLVNAVSAKSDVFSYGMTLLELVGGRRNFDPATATDDAASAAATPDFTRDFFPYIVREKMARGELMEAVDAAMALVDQEEVEAVVKVALCCIQSRWDMRPTMLTVVDMLEGRVAVDLPIQSRRLSTVNFSDLSSSYSLTHNQ